MKCKKHYADMEKYAEYKRRMQRSYRQRTGMYERRRWTIGEIEKVMAHNKTDRELSKEIKRSIGAIQKMRNKIRKENNCSRWES